MLGKNHRGKERTGSSCKVPQSRQLLVFVIRMRGSLVLLYDSSFSMLLSTAIRFVSDSFSQIP